MRISPSSDLVSEQFRRKSKRAPTAKSLIYKEVGRNPEYRVSQIFARFRADCHRVCRRIGQWWRLRAEAKAARRIPTRQLNARELDVLLGSLRRGGAR